MLKQPTMQRSHAAFLFTELLLLSWLGICHSKEYTYWLTDHKINLVNYVAEVGTNVLITSPISTAPSGSQWFSLNNMNGELSYSETTEVSVVTLSYDDPFHSDFKYDEFSRWLRIWNVRLDSADVFRVHARENMTENTVDVEVTLMIFEEHKCGFNWTPENATKGDMLIMNCSAIVNGLWNASLVFRNDFDGSETRGLVLECGRKPSVGYRICSTVRIRAATNIFAYSCLLTFPSSGKLDSLNPTFKNSIGTTDFNAKVVCNLPKIYLQSIPSDITFLCNRKLCEDTASVDDTVTCLAPSYPEPVFDIRSHRLSTGQETEPRDQGIERNNTNTRIKRNIASEDEINLKEITVDKIKVSENYRISRGDIGQVEITCNTSNVLGAGYKALLLEVKPKPDMNTGHREPKAAGEFHPFGGMSMWCNGRKCTNMARLRIGDNIACRYDEKIVGGKMNFVLKIDGFEKNVQKPCVYTLRMEDVGKKTVQCLGYIDSSISVLEITVFVVCNFRYPYGNPHHTEDYDNVEENLAVSFKNEGLVILCNDALCNKSGRVIHTGSYVTCRYTDQRVSSVNLYVDGDLKFSKEQQVVGTKEGFYKISNEDHDKDLNVTCVDSINSTITASVIVTPRLWPCPTDDDDKEDAKHRGVNRDANIVTHGLAKDQPDIRDIRNSGEETFVLPGFILILVAVIASAKLNT